MAEPEAYGVIRSDVPIPAPQEETYWDDMAVGDSVLFPMERERNVLAHLFHHKRLNAGWDYTTRLEPFGIRIWRVA